MSLFLNHKYIPRPLTDGWLERALTDIYIELYKGKWGGIVPPPPQDEDVSFLYSLNDRFVAVHKKHLKFGANIVEFGENWIRNAYVFFDYSKIESVCKWIDKNDPLIMGPNVPTYYALPSDRHFYGTDFQYWDDDPV